VHLETDKKADEIEIPIFLKINKDVTKDREYSAE